MKDEISLHLKRRLHGVWDLWNHLPRLMFEEFLPPDHGPVRVLTSDEIKLLYGAKK